MKSVESIQLALRRGLDYSRQGRFAEATACFNEALALDPEHVEARCSLGNICSHEGRLSEAVIHYQAALARSPGCFEAQFNLGDAYLGLGRADDAATCFRSALALVPDCAEAHLMLGLALSRLGRLEESITCYQRAIAHKPDFAEAHNNLSNALLGLGRLEEAVACCHKAIDFQPGLALARYNLGRAYYLQGRLEEAEACFLRALELRPDYAEAYNNLSTVARQRGDLDQASMLCRKALALDPDYALAHYNLGLICLAQGKASAAATNLQRALDLNPDYAEAHNHLGRAFGEAGRLDDALACYRKAIALKPDYLDAHLNLATALTNQGSMDAAGGAYDRAITIDPGSAAALSCKTFFMNYLATTTPAELHAAHRRFAEACEAPLKPYWRPHANARDPARRLRIGYVSADFRHHSVASFIEPVLARHDRARFEVFCYYNNTERDEVTERLAGLADHWLACIGLTDEQLAGRIRQDGIDILVDLAGHTSGHRLLAFARKPAPVQVTWLGYPATTGLTAMDYRLCTTDTDPPGQEAWHSETLYRLPRTLWCYRPPSERMLEPHTPARLTGAVTFGSMNSYAKISPEAFAVWMQILRAVPGSRLVMTSVPEGSVREALARRVAGHGIAPERVIAHARLPQEQYRQVLGQIDIALDPFPYNGTTTTCETLRSGIPVVTLTGETSVARSGYALLKTVGLEELAAADAADYVRLAVALAHDTARLTRLREALPARFDASPLRDEAGLARDLEHAFREMWRTWCVSGGGRQEIAGAAQASSDVDRIQRALQQGHDHFLQGRLDEAAACFREVLALQPDHAEAWRKLGNTCFARDRLDEAVEYYQRAVTLDPALTAAHYNLALTYTKQGRLEPAAASYEAALVLDPDFADACSNLAHIYFELDRLDDALHCSRKMITLKPGFAPAHYNLGLILFKMCRLDEAVTSYRTAIALKPDFAEAYSNLAHTYIELERLDEALQCCQKSIAIAPYFAPAHYNLGLALSRMRRLDEAVTSYQSAIALKPDYIDAYSNLGSTLTCMGRTEVAMQSFIKALALNPASDKAHSARLLSIQYRTLTTPAESYAAHREFAARCEASLRPSWRPHHNSRDPERRLKIGYVSADFRRHSVATFIEPVLARHDRGCSEVFCYFSSVMRDDWTERLSALPDHWIDCASLGDEQLAGRIRQDGIDILVDLNGHTSGHRLLAFARKPAPVQVTWLGYPATTGLDAMDYRLCTADTDPPGAEAWHSEALYRLPRSLWCYRPIAERLAAGPPPASLNGYVTFGSMNNLAKISPETITRWTEILCALPTARLVMTSVPEGSARTALQQRFADHGIAPERVVLHDKLPYADYWRLLRQIDIALDPFPYTGTTTTCETLWSGIPVVTLIGQTSVARSGYALLKTVGLTELAAADEAEYVRLAVALANDTERLTRLRKELPQRFDASPLRDEAGFTRELEDAYRIMWRKWCGAPPGHPA